MKKQNDRPTKEDMYFRYKSTLDWLKRTVDKLPDPNDRPATSEELVHVAWIALSALTFFGDFEEFEQKQDQENEKEGSSHE